MLIEITWSNTKRKMPEDKSPSPSSRQPIPTRWRVLSQGWRSGNSARLPPMWPGFDSDPVPYVGWVCCWFSTSLKGFSPGCPVSPPSLPQKPTLQIGHLHNPFTWYWINYAGTQITQWDFQNKRTRTIPARLHFVLKVPLLHNLFRTTWPNCAKGLFQFDPTWKSAKAHVASSINTVF